MITTVFLIQLVAFQLWYITSAQVVNSNLPAYLPSVRIHKKTYRVIGGFLLLVAFSLFILRFGWMTGICAGIAGFMGTGCLAVTLNPFGYISPKAVALIYALLLILELSV